jgi:hypothetical protein
VEEALAEVLQLSEEGGVDGLQRADVDRVALAVDLVVHLPLVGVEGLSLLLLLPQPLALDGLSHRLGEVFDGLEALAEAVGQTWETA